MIEVCAKPSLSAAQNAAGPHDYLLIDRRNACTSGTAPW